MSILALVRLVAFQNFTPIFVPQYGWMTWLSLTQHVATTCWISLSTIDHRNISRSESIRAVNNGGDSERILNMECWVQCHSSVLEEEVAATAARLLGQAPQRCVLGSLDTLFVKTCLCSSIWLFVYRLLCLLCSALCLILSGFEQKKPETFNDIRIYY